MAGALPPKPPADKGHHGRDLIILLWVFTGVTLAVVLLRAFTACRRRKVSLDDWLMFVAMLCFIGWSICGTLMAVKGGVGHLYFVLMRGPAVVEEVVKLNWITQIWGIAGVSFGKISVAFLILRVMGSTAGRMSKIFLYVLVAVTVIIDSLACIFTFVQCDPPRKLWDTAVPGSCWNPNVMASYAVFVGVMNGVIDIALALFPAAAVFLRLQVPKRVKFELCALFSGGIFAGICSFIKSKQLLALSNRADFSWATYAIFVWVTLELFLVISLGSVPSLRQLGPHKRSSEIDIPYVFTQERNEVAQQLSVPTQARPPTTQSAKKVMSHTSQSDNSGSDAAFEADTGDTSPIGHNHERDYP